MALLLQIALGLVVAGGIGFGVWNHKQNEMERREDGTEQRYNQQATIDANAAVQLNAGNTNADLDADLKAIDGQLNIVTQSSTSIDQSMNDKPINE